MPLRECIHQAEAKRMDDYEKQILELPRVKQVLELIGLITITWNSIDSLWYLIFTCMLHETPRSKADQIFKQFNSGSSQRQMIISLANEAFQEGSEFKKELKKLSETTNELSAIRNDMTHGVYFFDHLNGEPGLRIAPMGVMNRRINKLSEVGTELVNTLKTAFDKIYLHEKELDDFRIILSQEYLPDRQKNRPLPKDTLDSMPTEVLKNLPRELRDRIAPPRFKAKD